MDPLAPLAPLGTMEPRRAQCINPSHIGDGPDTLCTHCARHPSPHLPTRGHTMRQHIEDAAGAAIIFAFIYLLMSL